LHESLTDVSEALQHAVDHVLCSLWIEPLLPLIDYHDPSVNGRWFEEALIDPGIP